MKNQIEREFYNFKIQHLSLKYAYKNLLGKPFLFAASHLAFLIFFLYLYSRIPVTIPEDFLAFSQISLFFIFLSIYFASIFNLGACKNLKEYLLTFTKIGLVDHLGLPPYPLYHKNNKDGIQILELYAPGFLLSDFDKFREQIETALNINVLLVQQKKDQKDIIIMTFCNSKSLPTNIYYDKNKHLGFDDKIRIGVTQSDFAEIDFNKTPHGIICGSTGGGKSVLSKVILTQARDKGAEIYVIDPKMSDDFKEFNPLYSLEQALNLTESVLFEISARQQSADKDYSRIIVLIDEASFLMDTTGLQKDEKEQANKLIRNLTNIARIGRAFKVNLIFTTQRSDSTHSLPGNLKCNCGLRISSRLPDRASSEVIMGDASAYNLPNIPGRFVMNDGSQTVVFQAFNIK